MLRGWGTEGKDRDGDEGRHRATEERGRGKEDESVEGNEIIGML